MKGIRRATVTIFAVLLVCMAGAASAETKTSGYASVDFMSNYVWRGIKSTPNAAIQPSVGISYGAFSTNLWANYDANSQKATETDLTLDYGISLGKVGLNVGYIYYAFNGIHDTQELYLSASYDTLLSPKLAIYADFDQGDGAFVIASVSHAIELAKDIPLTLGASASYNINNKIMGSPDGVKEDFSNFYNGELTASVGIPVTGNLSIAPKIAYSFPLSTDAKNAIKGVNFGDSGSVLYGGLNVTLSF
jgi:hypothetical protein